MKKNIIIGVLVLLNVCTLMFAFVKNLEAEKQREIAVFNMEQAIEMSKKVREAEMEAKKAFELAHAAQKNIVEANYKSNR